MFRLRWKVKAREVATLFTAPSKTIFLPVFLSILISVIFGLELIKYNLSYGDIRSFNSVWFGSTRYSSAWQPEGLGKFDSRPFSDVVISAVSTGLGEGG